MAAESQPIDIAHLPELARLADEVRATRRPRVLRRDNEDIAVLTPVPVARPKRTRQGGDDTLLRLIGIASGPDDGIHDVAEHHDQYLADAYTDTHE